MEVLAPNYGSIAPNYDSIAPNYGSIAPNYGSISTKLWSEMMILGQQLQHFEPELRWKSEWFSQWIHVQLISYYS